MGLKSNVKIVECQRELVCVDRLFVLDWSSFLPVIYFPGSTRVVLAFANGFNSSPICMNKLWAYQKRVCFESYRILSITEWVA